jgi:hypothetical protein
VSSEKDFTLEALKRSIQCPCCGVSRLKPKAPTIHEVPWSDCACRDMEPCVAHRANPESDTVPLRPTDADLAEKGQRIYVDRLKRHMELVSKFAWVKQLMMKAGVE